MSDEPAVTPDPLPAPIVVEKGVVEQGVVEQGVVENASGPRWFRRLSSVLFVVFCFELGLFLLVYPWTDAWADNYFSVTLPGSALSTWRTLWNNPYVRGGVSGLGLVNVWIAVAEVFRMFAARGQAGH